ncbi:MAG: glycosyltransferase family 1 protein [Candidatus Moranbacteria bacterium]|nr:glycosyltransferase family 1 protein [Candidatus Moranbacteria bacterium]
MIIGIDASRAFQKNKTGIEEYSYQVIKNLRNYLRDEQVILYMNPAINIKPDFDIPEKWKIKILRAPIFWTQARLSLEMLFHPVDLLFVPAHTVPLIHPKKTFVTIHGLEYEFCPKAYSFWQRFYMRRVIKNSCKWAKRIIAVSENTKKDLMKLYKVSEEKIKVIYEGVGDIELKAQSSKFKATAQNSKLLDNRYLLFVGRLEKRKNIQGIIEAFEILKDKHNISHKLYLIGKYGYGKENIKNKIANSKYKEDIILTGYVNDEDKLGLLKKADVFLFPTFYEGFGLPILEAQSVGIPVVTSNISSMPEIAGDSAVLVDPNSPDEIAEAAYKLISNESYKNDIIEKGYNNTKRFSWEKCAKEISNIIQIC